MTEFWYDILIHLAILTGICLLLGKDLKQLLDKENKSGNYIYLIPFANFVKWFKTINLPAFLLPFLFQAYYLPLWWANTIAVLIFMIAVIRTLALFTRLPYKHYFTGGVTVFFMILFLIWPEHHRLFLLILIAIVSGIFRKFKGQIIITKADPSYLTMSIQQFKKQKIAVFAVYLLLSLTWIAMNADYIANNKPMYVKVYGQAYYPVYESLLNDKAYITIEAKKTPYDLVDWRSFEHKIFTLVPYSPTEQDAGNRNFKRPSDPQMGDNFKPLPIRYRHWLGTDKTGGDVLAGLIHGARISLSIGFISMGIATLIGILLGALGGYFGNHSLKLTYGNIILGLAGLLLGYFYAFVAMDYQATEARFAGYAVWWIYCKKMLIFFGIPVLCIWFSQWIKRYGILSKFITFPVDGLVLRSMELLNSVPALLFIIILAAMIQERSLFTLMLIIGLLSWTGIARFTRAEFLRIRSLGYIESAKALGYSNFRIILGHALPNTLAPVLVTVAFGIAGAILIESSLSFLNIGVPDNVVSWGSMLNSAKGNRDADYMILLPGLAIFITITVYNLIGEGLRDALDPKLKK